MTKPNSFIYINLNSIIGKYMATCIVVGNIVVARGVIKAANKFTKKSSKKEND